MIRRRVTVHGVVQGVGFRYVCAREAESHGVDGWVRNRPDGGVEAVFEGDEAAVEAMLDWAREGPQSARVARVDVAEEPPEGLAEFEIRYF